MSYRTVSYTSGASTPVDPPVIFFETLPELKDLDGQPFRASTWYYRQFANGVVKAIGVRPSPNAAAPLQFYAGMLTGDSTWTDDSEAYATLQKVLKSECRLDGRTLPLTLKVLPVVLRRWGYSVTTAKAVTRDFHAKPLPYRTAAPDGVPPPASVVPVSHAPEAAAAAPDFSELAEHLRASKAQAEAAASADSARLRDFVAELSAKVDELVRAASERDGRHHLEVAQLKAVATQETAMLREQLLLKDDEIVALEAKLAEVTAVLEAERDQVALALAGQKAAEEEVEDARKRLEAASRAAAAASPSPTRPSDFEAVQLLSRSLAEAVSMLSRGASVASTAREVSLIKDEAFFLKEATSRRQATFNGVWAGLRARVAPAGWDAQLSCTKKLAPFAEDAPMCALVPKLIATFLPDLSSQLKQLHLPVAASVIHVEATSRNVLGAIALSALFDLKWDPTRLRLWLLDAQYLAGWEARFGKTKSAAAIEQEFKGFIAKVVELRAGQSVDQWLPRYGLQLMEKQHGFDVAPVVAESGAPVAPATGGEKAVLHAHLYHCWYDLLSVDETSRDPKLLGDTGTRRVRKLPWIPPARVSIPTASGEVVPIELHWHWDKEELS